MLNLRLMTLSLVFAMMSFSVHASADSKAAAPIPLNASLSKQLNEFMAMNADLFARVGRIPAKNGRAYAAVLRCSDPQETGHLDDRAYCDSEVIGDASLTEDVKNEALTSQLLKLMKQTKGFYGGTAQGWVGYDAQINCVTASLNKPAACTAEPAMKDQASDGFDDIDNGMED